jgi:beta-glucanase (GH16 family)
LELIELARGPWPASVGCGNPDSASTKGNRVKFWMSLMPAAVLTAIVVAAAGAQTVPAPAGKLWNPTWSDEFNAGASDLSGWVYDIGTGQDGWGNGESQSYTNSTNNVSVSGGALRITAIGTQSGANTNYTSARIRTTNIFNQAYGLFEIRAKLPAGQGLWPAVWMMPRDSVYGGWPRSGEIDIMEARGQNTGQVGGAVHSGTSPQMLATMSASYNPAGFDITQFHTYSLQWTAGPSPSQAGTLRWYVDGSLYQTRTGGWVVPAGASNMDAPFDQPFYLILNLAVGGQYVDYLTPGAGSYEMQVDYARAYQLANVPEPTGVSAILLATGVFGLRRRRSVSSC